MVDMIYSHIYGAGIVQGIFLFFALFSKRENSIPNRILAALSLVIIAELTVSLLIVHNAAGDMTLILSAPVLFLVGPLFYMYISTLTSRITRLGRRELYHLAPFFGGYLYDILYNLGESAAVIPSTDTVFLIFDSLFIILQLFHLGTYAFLARRELKRNLKKFRIFFGS